MLVGPAATYWLIIFNNINSLVTAACCDTNKHTNTIFSTGGANDREPEQ